MSRLVFWCPQICDFFNGIGRIYALRRGSEEALDDSSSALRRAVYDAPPLELQTGMPSLRALSARFAEIPEPGKTMTPIGMAPSI